MSESAIPILLVEDDHIDVMNVQRAFKKNNITNPLYIAFNGVEALNMLKGINGKPKLTPTPQIILTDINMPNLDGYGVISAIRGGSVHRNVPILVLTTESTPHLKARAREAGATGWIVKPFDDAAIVSVVRRVTGAKV